MILQKIIEIISSFLTSLLDLVPNLPQLPSNITNTIDSVYSFIFSQVALLNLFIPIQLCITLIGLVLSVMIFKFTWSIIAFVGSKLHLLG